MWYNNHLTLNVLGWGQGSSLFIHMDPKLSTYLKDNNCSVIFVKQARAFSSWNILTPFYDMLRGFRHSSVGKESASNAGDLGSIPGWGRSSGEGKGYPLQYSGLENSMDCIVHGVTKSRTQLSNFHRDWNENGPFPVLWPPVFQISWHSEQHFHSILLGFEIAAGILSPLLAL